MVYGNSDVSISLVNLTSGSKGDDEDDNWGGGSGSGDSQGESTAAYLLTSSRGLPGRDHQTNKSDDLSSLLIYIASAIVVVLVIVVLIIFIICCRRRARKRKRRDDPFYNGQGCDLKVISSNKDTKVTGSSPSRNTKYDQIAETYLTPPTTLAPPPPPSALTLSNTRPRAAPEAQKLLSASDSQYSSAITSAPELSLLLQDSEPHHYEELDQVYSGEGQDSKYCTAQVDIDASKDRHKKTYPVAKPRKSLSNLDEPCEAAAERSRSVSPVMSPDK